MSRLRRTSLLVAVASIALGWPRPLPAQSRATGLLVGARAQIEDLNVDSAFALLTQALDRSAGATSGERVRGFTLFAIAELIRGNRTAARQSFEQALRLDPTLRVDSLADLQSDVLVVFGEVRAAILPGLTVAGPLFTVRVDLPADTVVPSDGGRLVVSVRPTTGARVVTVLEPEDSAGVVVWSDTQFVAATGIVAWDLRGRDAEIVPPGRYVLRVTATYSTGQPSPLVEHVLVISRLPVDTMPHPPSLPDSAFEPETLRLRLGPARSLVAAAAFGAAAALLPSALGRGELNQGRGPGGAAYAVGGALSVAGLVSFLAGHRSRPIPASIARNRERWEQHERQRARIVEANAAVLRSAAVRVQLEGAAR